MITTKHQSSSRDTTKTHYSHLSSQSSGTQWHACGDSCHSSKSGHELRCRSEWDCGSPCYGHYAERSTGSTNDLSHLVDKHSRLKHLILIHVSHVQVTDAAWLHACVTIVSLFKFFNSLQSPAGSLTFHLHSPQFSPSPCSPSQTASIPTTPLRSSKRAN